jgi:hypothetical protein
MEANTPTTGAGAIVAQPIEASSAIYCDHDYNKGPLICYVHSIREAALIAESLGENPLDIEHALEVRRMLASNNA